MMKPALINWTARITEVTDVTSKNHIPPDVTFTIEGHDGVHQEIKAHKMVMAMASQVFNEMFLGEKEEKDRYVQRSWILVQGTNITKASFEIMVNAIYNTTPIEDSLKNKSVHQVFAVLGLVKKYKIPELSIAVEKHLAFYVLTDDTVLEVAADAMQCSTVFLELQDEAHKLLVLCSKFLKPTFKDAQSVFQYVAQNEDRKEVVHKLQVLMKDIATPTASHKSKCLITVGGKAPSKAPKSSLKTAPKKRSSKSSLPSSSYLKLEPWNSDDENSDDDGYTPRRAYKRKTLEILIPEIKEKLPQMKKSEETEGPDLSFFDDIRIEDPRVSDLCNRTSEPSPYIILVTCLQRNYGLGDTHITQELSMKRNQKNEYTMRVNKREVSVICRNKKDGKQLAAQKLLQQLHPHITSWRSLLRMYGNRSIRQFKQKKEKETEVTGATHVFD